ncbi:acylneuraminate cytidylyltransferase [Polaribacter sp. SA4-10]|uniref:acylneuraminate cytidylyltransferase family protein n=1 Tax=Polaribacter sp. SA4-10 TaxID=754397 RepID=UPI000B3D0388|nr:acylneuraminate cytidylyltransferase family protein [Polaribacter sp. SA4-10]ARV05505.1 acylneuraminate cytidylyltransferase [Polaribacter sp. SA4-10]
MKVIAIIPARGGSKGIPRKNIINFLGKPLIQWTIEAALKSKYITDVVVSSDDDEILKEAKKNKEVLVIKRPFELAQDNSKTVPVLTHVLESLKEIKFDYLILLQPTSPLRTSKDIDLAFKKLLSSEATSLISVCELEHHPYKSFKVDEKGYLQGIINNNYPFYPRQELPKTYKANGAIYIIEEEEFIKKKTLLTNKTTHFEMSTESSLDIDTLDDIKQ